MFIHSQKTKKSLIGLIELKSNLKVIFFGIGSIGKRHLMNLKSIMKTENVQLDIYAYRSNKNADVIEGVTNIYTIEDLASDYDIAFVTNPTSLHFETIEILEGKAKWYFIEKPVFEKAYAIDQSLPVENYYIAAPLRYKKAMTQAKQIIAEEKVLHSRIICSSFLPEWRNDDYRQSYSAQSSLGGGVELDCIHEVDYAVHLFGLPEAFKSMIGKVSDLEISSNDTANYLLEYVDKYVEIHVDYFGRKAVRKLELITENDTYEVDLNNDTFLTLSSGEIINFDEDRNDMYMNELYYFLTQVMTNTSNENNLEHALDVLKIAKGE